MPEAKGKPIKQFKPYKNDKSVIDSWKCQCYYAVLYVYVVLNQYM